MVYSEHDDLGVGLLDRYLPPAQIDPDDVLLMRRVGVTMFFGGAASALLGIFTVQETDFGRQSQFVLSLVLILLGCSFLLMRPRASVFRVGVLGATTVISAMVATAQPVSTTEFFYLWPVVFAAYFLGRRCTVVTLVWLAISLLVALSITKDDYLVRSDVFISTMASVGLVGAVVLLMRERERRLLAGLTAAARTDALTGLLNRHGLEPELQRIVGEARQTGVPLAIALFDIDHFKWFNDAHGHLQGDEALRRIGAVLGGVTRETDCVARFGGEEFAVILPGATAEGGKAFADRVAVALSEEDGDEALRITASCGVAELGWGDQVDHVLARADEALYAAKDAGRNRTAWWEGERIRVGAPLGGSELQSRRNAQRAPRAYVIRMADRAREITPEPTIDDGVGEPRRFG